MSEPLRWLLPAGQRSPTATVLAALRHAVAGPRHGSWGLPAFLLPHQVEAARRVAGSLAAFRGALLADAVGLGKTYVAVAVATRFRSACAVVPAAIAPQWNRVAAACGVPLAIGTHESLSRGSAVPPGELVVVDEAHRFRNPDTSRYARLARDISGRPVLFVTATPVVNRGADLVHLLRLFLPDHALACFGVRSLEEEARRSGNHSLLRAASPLIVARSGQVAFPVGDAMPTVRARGTIAVAPADPDTFAALLDVLATLQYPAAGSATGAQLLRLHAHARLASSVAALHETLRRHAAFLDRARQAARLGRAPSRALYRTLFGTGDDLQLPLDILVPDAADRPPDARDLDAEAARVRHAVRLAASASRAAGPKSRRLLQILADRERRSTLVFTSGVATAHDLARRLGWHGVAVVGGGRARIASGPIGLEEVLDLFAPQARGVTPPPVAIRVRTLVTTDLLSEGLDLQDADAVVHFDLPWTPLRLAQRVGRAARLGSVHPSVAVWWFIPPPELEERLRLLQRLERKTVEQLRLAVPVTSAVGRGARVNRQLEARERFVGSLATSPNSRGTCPLTSVVRGPLAAAAVLRWHLGRVSVPEWVVFEGRPLRVVDDLEQAIGRLRQLVVCGASSRAVPPCIKAALQILIRSRLRDVRAGPGDRRTLRLRHLVLRRARIAGSLRNAATLAALDHALDRLASGLPVGPTVELDALLRAPTHPRVLRTWLAGQSAPFGRDPTVTVEALLCGDGTGAW